MKKNLKGVLCLGIAAVLCLSMTAQAAGLPSPDTDVADRAAAFYEGAGQEFVKISHPENPTSTQTTNTADGLIDYLGDGRMGVPGVDPGAEGQGDRGQSYCWAAAAWGDWMYAATQYNPMMSTIGLMDSGLGHDYDPGLMVSLINTMYRGEFFTGEEDGKNPGSVLSKINVKTGEVKILMSREKTGTNVNFRNAVNFNGKLYFCGAVNGVPSIYEVDPAQDDKITCVFKDESMNRPDAWPEALKKKLSPTIRGMSVYGDCLVINCVGLDENPYIAISRDPSQGFRKIAFAWEDVENQVPGELLGYPACHLQDSIYGGSIWEIVTYHNSLYVAMCTGTPENSPDGGKTMQSFAVIRGDCEGDPLLRESWTWTPVIGDQDDGAKYPFGIDPERTRSGACSLMVFDDHLYIGEYNDTEIALMNILFGVDARFMVDNLEQSVNLYRMDEDENMELVVGDPTEMFPEGGLSGLGSGFGAHENQYVWRMDTFQDKLYIGTFDESSLLYPVGQFSSGDILHLTPEQWDRQLMYLKDLLEKLLQAGSTGVTTFSQLPACTQEQLDVMQEILDAYGSVPANVSILDLPETLSQGGSGQITSFRELHQAMLLLSGMLEQDDSWTDMEKLEAMIRFAQFMEKLYDFFSDPENMEKLPEIIREIYEQVLNEENIQKVVAMAQCAFYMKDSTRGFDLAVTQDGIHFDIITRDGLGDNHNHGLRTFAVNQDPENPWMCLGTANPFYGTQIWRLQDESLVLPGEGDTDPTDPDPTDPDPTNPDPTDPDPTDPDPTDPDPTNPDPTDPVDPDPTDPEVPEPSETTVPAVKPDVPVTPVTGDLFPLTGLLALMTVCGASLLVLLKKRKI